MLLKPKPRVLLHYPVIAMLDERAEKCAGANEDGGILLGSYRGPHLEVMGFTRSGKADERRRYSFIRQDSLHQETATKAWRKSSKTVTFVGEWHTHPLGGPDPSGIDLDSWSELVQNAKEPMVFAVVAPKRWALYLIRSGLFQRRSKSLVPIEKGELGVVFQTGGLWSRSWRSKLI